MQFAKGVFEGYLLSQQVFSSFCIFFPWLFSSNSILKHDYMIMWIIVEFIFQLINLGLCLLLLLFKKKENYNFLLLALLSLTSFYCLHFFKKKLATVPCTVAMNFNFFFDGTVAINQQPLIFLFSFFILVIFLFFYLFLFLLFCCIVTYFYLQLAFLFFIFLFVCLIYFIVLLF